MRGNYMVRSRTAAGDGSMDLLCDTVMVEEILPRLPPNDLLRLRAASRRYSALAHRPDFAARYWQHAGVFFRPYEWVRPRFLPGDGVRGQHAPVCGADLSFLPGPSAREEAYLRTRAADAPGNLKWRRAMAIMHSAGGLLLCSRGSSLPIHFYVFNPVTQQWVALPELPWIPKEWQNGLLTLDEDGNAEDGGNTSTTKKSFRVLLFNHPYHWRKAGGRISLSLFSSATGRGAAARLDAPVPVDYFNAYSHTVSQRGTAVYWIWTEDRALVYDSVDHSAHAIPLPQCLDNGEYNRIVAEPQHGGFLRYAQSNASVLEVWESTKKRAGNVRWTLVHRLEFAEWWYTAEAAAGIRSGHIKPIAFHPVKDGIVFLGMSTVVVAYSIHDGTMRVQCLDDHYMTYEHPSITFPYLHPPYPVPIPRIK